MINNSSWVSITVFYRQSEVIDNLGFIKDADGLNLQSLWDEFQATEPDSDGLFLDFLKSKGFETWEDKTQKVILVTD